MITKTRTITFIANEWVIQLNKLTCYSLTCNKCIALISGQAGTARNMVDRRTSGMHPTHSWTRVAAMLRYTRLIVGTLRVCDTLRFTLNIRVTDIVITAAARRRAVSLCAIGINAARGWVARLIYRYRPFCCG